MIYNLERDTVTGEVRLEAEDEFQALKSFIGSELQEDVSLINLLLNKLRESPLKAYELSGNSHTIVIVGENFEIENHYAEDECLRGLNSDLIELLEKLKILLT